MPTTRYADVITRIALADRNVRMDLATIALESVTQDGQAKLEVEERLCMPITGFLRTYQEMTQLIENMKKQGILQAAENEAGATPAVTATGADGAAGVAGVAGADIGKVDSDSKADKKDGKKSKS